MKNTKYYPTKYFFLAIIIISFVFLAVNFWELSKTYILYEPTLNISNQHGMILGEQEDIGILSDYLLMIKKIRVQAPIMLEVPTETESKYFKALEQGVAHFKGTSKPGESGNIVIFGHSSADIGASGRYNEIFAKLGNLEKNDDIIILNKKTRNELVYTIYGREVIKETDLSILEPTDESQLTIFTCWPIGSDEKRLVIYAKPK